MNYHSCDVRPAELSLGNISPFLKWAGGKRWLVPYFRELNPKLVGRYIEPFVGSGAVFFALAPKRALLADTNEWLIQTYRAVRDTPNLVFNSLKNHQRRHSKRYYYKVRSSRPTKLHTKAAKLIYLNKTCWNALFRVNLLGEFNVPKGTKSNILDPLENFFEWSNALSNCKLDVADFETTMSFAQLGDVVFADPPYITTHSNNGFIKYNETLFTWQDQERLAKAANAAARRGATVLISNSAHRSVRGLYEPFGAEFHNLSRSSVIGASSVSRRRVRELLIVLRPKLGYRA